MRITIQKQRDKGCLYGLVSSSWRSPRRHCPVKRTLLAPAFGALEFQRFMLGDGLGAFKLLPALLATRLVGRHKLKSSDERGSSEFTSAEAVAFKHWCDRIQRLVMPEDREQHRQAAGTTRQSLNRRRLRPASFFHGLVGFVYVTRPLAQAASNSSLSIVPSLSGSAILKLTI
jgi:hypothetical protein